MTPEYIRTYMTYLILLIIFAVAFHKIKCEILSSPVQRIDNFDIESINKQDDVHNRPGDSQPDSPNAEDGLQGNGKTLPVGRGAGGQVGRSPEKGSGGRNKQQHG